MNKFIALTAGAFVALAASQASAATVSNSATFGPTKTDFTTNSLTLQPFNTSLGTLTSVTVNLSANASVAGTVTNSTTSNQTFKVSTTTTVSLSSSSASISSLTVDLNSTQSYAAVAAGATANYGPFSPANTTGDVAATPLSAFTSGPINFTANTLSGTTITGGGNNISAAINSTASGTVTVTYNYTPTPPPSTVPEPASMALLGMGLAGLGLIRRRSV